MRTEISRVFYVEAAHQLPHVPEGHKCGRLHGHSYRITLRLEGEVDPETGWIMDFGEVDEAWEPIHEMLDHRFLNQVEGLENPTSEILARWIIERVRLPKGRLTAVTISETCTAECTVYAEG